MLKQVSIHYDFHATAHRYFDPVVALMKFYEQNRTAVSRMQQLIRSRVFQLQYSIDGPRDVYQFQSPLPYVKLTYDHPQNSSSKTMNPDAIRYETREPQTAAVVVNNGWPMVTDDQGGTRPEKDAYDVIIELCLQWHSGSAVRVRNATVPECWDGRLDKQLNKCVPLQRGSR